MADSLTVRRRHGAGSEPARRPRSPATPPGRSSSRVIEVSASRSRASLSPGAPRAFAFAANHFFARTATSAGDSSSFRVARLLPVPDGSSISVIRSPAEHVGHRHRHLGAGSLGPGEGGIHVGHVDVQATAVTLEAGRLDTATLGAHVAQHHDRFADLHLGVHDALAIRLGQAHPLLRAQGLPVEVERRSDVLYREVGRHAVIALGIPFIVRVWVHSISSLRAEAGFV